MSMYWRRERRRLYRLVACPDCEAALGQPCQFDGAPTRICYARRMAGVAERSRRQHAAWVARQDPADLADPLAWIRRHMGLTRP